jgi:hypothetical protein
VGFDAALSDNARPSASAELDQKILRLIFISIEQFLAKLRPFAQSSRHFAEKILRQSFVRPLTARSRTASMNSRAREKLSHAND